MGSMKICDVCGGLCLCWESWNDSLHQRPSQPSNEEFLIDFCVHSERKNNIYETRHTDQSLYPRRWNNRSEVETVSWNALRVHWNHKLMWTQLVLVVEANAEMQSQMDLVCQFLWREEQYQCMKIPFLLFVFFFFFVVISQIDFRFSDQELGPVSFFRLQSNPQRLILQVCMLLSSSLTSYCFLIITEFYNMPSLH